MTYFISLQEHLEQEHAIDVKEYAKTFDIEDEGHVDPENEEENQGKTIILLKKYQILYFIRFAFSVDSNYKNRELE